MKRGRRELRVWQQAVELVEHVYRVTSTFPKEQIYGLAQQMRRAAVSVPGNVAEGAARKGTRELLRVASVASGSRAELDTQREVASRLGCAFDKDALRERFDAVRALLVAMMESLRDKWDSSRFTFHLSRFTKNGKT